MVLSLLFSQQEPGSRGIPWMVTIPVALVIVLLAVVSHFYLQRAPELTDKDTIVLSDFANSH